MAKLNFDKQNKGKSLLKERLKTCEMLFLTLLNSIEQAVIIIKNEQIVEINTKALQLFRYTESEIKQLPLSELLPTSQTQDINDFINFLKTPENKIYANKSWSFKGKNNIQFSVNVECSHIHEINTLQLILKPVQSHHLKNTDLNKPKDAGITQDIVEYAKDAYIIWNMQNEILFISPCFEEITGRKSQELKSNPIGFSDWIHPDDREYIMNEFNLSRTENYPGLDLKCRILTKGKQVKWLWYRETTINDDNNDIIRRLGIVSDISRMKIIEEELRENEAKLKNSETTYREIFNLSTSIIHIHDYDTYEVVDANQLAVESSGYSYDQVIGRSIDEFIKGEYPFSVTEAKKYLDRVKDEELISFEWFTEYQNGKLTWTYNHMKVATINGIKRIMVIGNDITDKKMTEIELEKTQKILEASIVQSPAGIIIGDAPSCNIRLINSKAFDMFGKFPTEFENFKKEQKLLWDTYDLNGNKIELDELPLPKAILKGKITTGEELVFINNRNEKKYISTNSAPVYDSDNNIIAGIVIFEDISDKIQASKELSKSKRMLETILDTIPTRVFWKDLDFKYLGCNKIFLHDAGLNHLPEILGKTDYELTWKDNADIYRNDDMQVIQSGKSKLNFEEPQTTSINNKIGWLKTSKVPLKDEEGNIIGVLGIYEEITQQKETLEELEQHKNNLESLISDRTEEIENINRVLHSTNEELSAKNNELNKANEKLKNEIEERKRIERELIDSQEKFRQFIEQSGEAIQLLDNEGRIVEWNKKSEELFELGKEEMIGQHVYDFEFSIQPENKKTEEQYNYIKNEIINYLHDKEKINPFNQEYSITTKSGINKELKIITFPIYTSTELLIGRIALDITESITSATEIEKYKNHLEDLVEQRTLELKQNEEQLAMVLKSVPMIFYTMNPAGNEIETWISDQIENLSGYDPKDYNIDTKFWQNKIHIEDKERVLSNFNDIYIDNHLVREYRWQIASGEYRWFLDQASLIKNEKNKPVRIIGSMLDITERKLAEESIIESERNYREIFNASADAIFIYDAETGSLLDVNNSMLELYGCSYKEALSLPFEAFNEGKAPFNFETTLILMKKALEEGSYQYEWRSRKKSGTLFWSEIRLKHVVIGDKDKIISLVRDITERKESESTIKYRLNYELLISEISSQFINMPPEEVDTSIEIALKDVAGFIQTDCCYLFIINELNNRLNLSHLWKNQKVTLNKDKLKQVPIEGLEWHLNQLNEDKAVIINSIDDIPNEAALVKEIISKQKISTLVDVPLNFQGKIIGFFGVGNHEGRRNWNNDEISLLRIIGQIILNAIQRKNILNDLLVSERTHREIFNATNEAILIHEISTGKIEDANSAALKTFNFNYDEMVQLNISDLIESSAELSENGAIGLLKKAREEESNVFEWKAKRKNRTEFWAEISLKKALILGKDKILSVIRDITDRKKTQDLLRESEDRFRSIVQQLSDIVMVLDKEAIVQYETPSLSSILGYTEGYITGKKIIDFIHPDDIDLLLIKIEQLSNNLTLSSSIELRFKNSKGEYLFMEILGNNMLMHPSINGFVITCHNITERKIMEKKILDAIIKTEEKERERFAKNLHDDLGPLLSSIKMYVNSISSADESERSTFIVEQLNEIVKEAINTTKEVSNDLSPHILLNYGLISAVESFINKISMDIEVEFDTNLRNKRISQEIETSVYRIIKELINNTIKHANAQNINLEITESNNNLYVEYSDNGKGFDEKQLKQESGMGVSNIMSRVRSMNGKYSFSQRKKKGMKFLLEVPITDMNLNVKDN